MVALEEGLVSLVECIPNISEGRRAAIVDGLSSAFRARTEVRLLHTHSDVDHNRSVFTVVGRPEALLVALEELYVGALQRLDLRRHVGVHPRIGAVDVCPFVALPEFGSTPTQCVALARELSARVAARFDLPVFLYRDAASAPHRRDLSGIRRGQFEGLADKLSAPEWRADFGPVQPHSTAGVTVVGARGPLIAYNMVLDTGELSVAREIAAAVRASSGGMPGIKALGVPLASRGLVQVSMNIEDPQATPLEVVSDAVAAKARLRGVEVRETELVGLIPAAAVTPAAAGWLQRGSFTPELVLENAIAASGLAR